MLLSQLTRGLLCCRMVHARDVEVTSLADDSRLVQPGALFIALRGGGIADRHLFLRDAAARGAVAAVVEEPQADILMPQLVVPDTRGVAGILASRFYGHPSRRLRVIGVTGTNGKTTTTHLIERVLTKAGYTVGLRGTVGKRIAGVTTEVGTTTPEAVEMQATLAEMVAAGCQYGVFEVSSQALDLKRDAGTRYRTAVFTNLTQDHLDYHGTMEAYKEAKGKLFARLGNTYSDDPAQMAYAVVNVDDPHADFFIGQTVAECIRFGMRADADVRAQDVVIRPDGVSFHVVTFAGEADVRMRLTGRFNVYNALAAIAAGLAEGVPLDVIAAALAEVEGVPGRLEPVDAGQPFTVLVDYAHTPDSLENALQTVREFAQGRVITVVGCGGDRDRTKRPVMARIACAYSDFVVFTSDNPRTEDPEAILDDMVAGLSVPDAGPLRGTWVRMADRRQAIACALTAARPGDVVLIAGKGHETYQIIGHTKHHFDDREVARDVLQSRQSR
ncbi:UDP-N-acetylmuramoyl-L-alanyl-D-glutamate--2,6-diaminopimelate ligase [Alicyclobacillus cellulosilyticus]|uniref:UDP-N-acetylmuramoyl-L-alanyl-D-glutamate--2,6-diaminopimelate ligase n=1 Tax=Alicyclobacillus cellulosilyticus TaxID=1003997 RepID=A0A917K252_9BACL|nr:UDP-N-acetylmuramoyl-L-alanyl-D-glutamate--2,6-diaminopimelate ligase [Alicyclobacillus cellulosilyticus]GGI97144.1 UDP-N-acetylmuramoyl-L-alanyl-D-glutamate--2,6-diaminopimelate ligase [Alicyclobacillus cellulosilyticus]